ncbi:MAG TPA: UDP-N-acetylmuramate--L-alanine ligase, partial [Chthoniobacterales bacterium]
MNPDELAQLLHGAPTRIHLIGVAGSGMSGIAALLLALGHQVSGSDRSETGEVQRLVRRGLKFSTPHHASQVRDAQAVIYSSAIRSGNPAYDEATRLCLPMFRRADALAALMTGKKGVVVCGMHGKTTTSAMAAYVLRASGLKPSHYVGAEIPILGSNARWDSEGELFVAEGDESDGTLVNYHPEHAIVLNIEPEHLDFYKDLAAIDAVYSRLTAQTTGWIFYCGDDEGATRVCGRLPNAISYGTRPGAAYRLADLSLRQFRPHFSVYRNEARLGEVHLGVPGEHNAVNSLAVIALAHEMGGEFSIIANALERFRGARRRFQVKYDDDYNVVVDDYGHHPTEIAATLATARSGGAKRIRVMFQPHRYSRTAALREEFGACFAEADSVVVSEIYAASEKPIPGISGQTIVDSLLAHGHSQARFEPNFDRIHKVVG